MHHLHHRPLTARAWPLILNRVDKIFFEPPHILSFWKIPRWTIEQKGPTKVYAMNYNNLVVSIHSQFTHSVWNWACLVEHNVNILPGIDKQKQRKTHFSDICCQLVTDLWIVQSFSKAWKRQCDQKCYFFYSSRRMTTTFHLIMLWHRYSEITCASTPRQHLR